MRESAKARAAREEKEYLEAEDIFDNCRLSNICAFIYQSQLYRKLALDLGYGDLKFEILRLSDLEYRFTQETTESRDNSFCVSPFIETDCNHESYNYNLEILVSEIDFLEEKKAEQEHLINIKRSALSKLTDEELIVLGLKVGFI